MKNRRANAVLFGFDFQRNAAIILMLENIKDLRSVRLEGNKDDTAGGHTTGTICTELGYIKANTDEIKAEQREQRKTNTEVVSRLTAVEASAKQAHQRINGLENRIK